MTKVVPAEPSFSEMRSLLMEGMRDLRDGKLSPQNALALSRMGQTIVMTVESEIRLRKAIGQKPNTDMIAPDVTPPLPPAPAPAINGTQPAKVVRRR